MAAFLARFSLVFLLLPAPADHAHATRAYTPGSVTAGLTVEAVCAPHRTERLRTASKAVRERVWAAYRIPKGDRRLYRLDDLVALELGGVQDEANLWPQPVAESKVKDRFENRLHREVCAHRVSLEWAQQWMVREWA